MEPSNVDAILHTPSHPVVLLVASCLRDHSQQAEESSLLSLADDIAAQGDYATATTLYERAAELSDEDVNINVRLGDARLASGDLQGALRSYRAALEKNIDSPTALLGLGSTQLRLEQGRKCVAQPTPSSTGT